MIKPGYIRFIDGKVKFEYYELEKSDKQKFWNVEFTHFLKGCYSVALKEYEASKQSLEVRNQQWSENNKTITAITIGDKVEWVKNKQPCKAEVGKTATIIELTKG